MKTLIVLLSLMLSVCHFAFSQTCKEGIFVAKQDCSEKYPCSNGATGGSTRTFQVISSNIEQRLEILNKEIGEPNKKDYLNITWSNVQIKGIEEPVNIILRDGVMTKVGNDLVLKYFNSEGVKQKALSNLDSKTWRTTELVITSANGINFIMNNNLEVLVANYLRKTMFNKADF